MSMSMSMSMSIDIHACNYPSIPLSIYVSIYQAHTREAHAAAAVE